MSGRGRALTARPRSASKAAIRACRDDEVEAILAIVNAAAEAYRGVIPADCWREPYMDLDELRSEIAAGVVFTGYEVDGRLAGLMGRQTVRNAELIRHAYVSPDHQGRGIGGDLLGVLRARTTRPVLVGTWTAAFWAISFYRRHGFEPAPDEVTAALLRTYWAVSARQVETSVVLTDPALNKDGALDLIRTADAGAPTLD